jgi:hypothetical protein
VGGSAASAMSSSAGSSRTGSGCLNGRFPLGLGLGRPFAILIESRIGLRRKVAVGAEDSNSFRGIGGRVPRS